jgi:predicted nucleic acid-binding Zn ribbon protein
MSDAFRGAGPAGSEDEPVSIMASLDGVVKSLRGPSRDAVGGLFGRWNEAVGEQVAQHVRPIKLDEGVLAVEVDDPTWATQVKFLAPTIIARLAEVTGASVDRIQVRVDPRQSRGSRM